MSVEVFFHACRVVSEEFVIEKCPTEHALFIKLLGDLGLTFADFAEEFQYEEATGDGITMKADFPESVSTLEQYDKIHGVVQAWSDLRDAFHAATIVAKKSALFLNCGYVSKESESFQMGDFGDGDLTLPAGLYVITGERAITPAGRKFADYIQSASWQTCS